MKPWLIPEEPHSYCNSGPLDPFSAKNQLYSKKYSSLPLLSDPEKKVTATFSLKDEREKAQRRTLLDKLGPQPSHAIQVIF